MPTYADLAPVEGKFRAKIREGNGHWIWTGTTTSSGRGVLWIDSTRNVPAHYVSLILHGQPLVEGALARKRCDVHGCVHPDHWSWQQPKRSTAGTRRAPERLLSGIAGQPWRNQAACKNHARPDIFFPLTLNSSSTDEERAQVASDEAAAAQVCAGCEVQVECGRYALFSGEEHGTWGGVTARAIRKARRQLDKVRTVAS